MEIEGNLINILDRSIAPVRIRIGQKRIEKIESIATAERYILPGFIDAHIHIESSMVTPSAFAQTAVRHGTIATVSDPHEIANVLGLKGIDFMIENGAKTPFKFFFGAPSCVPATQFETSGAEIDADDIKGLLARNDVFYLSEMMNYPGVLHSEPEVMAKIEAARAAGKSVDGHAPGLLGEDAERYAAAGISTDHECYTSEEAQGKLKLGMKVIVREGSAARNFDALHALIPNYYNNMMFCSDDKHPDELVHGHINAIVARCVKLGYDLFHVLQMACINPVTHYKLPVGLLREGDAADFIMVDDLKSFDVNMTVINGNTVFKDGVSHINIPATSRPNNFNINPIEAHDLSVKTQHGKIRVIEAHDGELVTSESLHVPTVENGFVVPDVARDLLKLVVVNRYAQHPPSVAFIRGFGIRDGAIASSVGHDSHNITAVGTSDHLIARAVNQVITHRGGISCVDQAQEEVLPLPIAGLISDLDVPSVGHHYEKLDAMAKQTGSQLRAPFMTLSFMALLVIPDLKLSDRGLFSGKQFRFVDLFENG